MGWGRKGWALPAGCSGSTRGGAHVGLMSGARQALPSPHPHDVRPQPGPCVQAVEFWVGRAGSPPAPALAEVNQPGSASPPHPNMLHRPPPLSHRHHHHPYHHSPPPANRDSHPRSQATSMCNPRAADTAASRASRRPSPASWQRPATGAHPHAAVPHAPLAATGFCRRQARPCVSPARSTAPHVLAGPPAHPTHHTHTHPNAAPPRW